MAEIQTPAAAGHDLAPAGRAAGPTGQAGDARAAKGDIVVSQAWSGYIFRAGLNSRYCALKLQIPADGAMFGTGLQVHPSAWPEPADARRLKDFFYVPQVQAVVENYNDYVCPVPAAQDVLLHLGRLGRPQRGGIA